MGGFVSTFPGVAGQRRSAQGTFSSVAGENTKKHPSRLDNVELEVTENYFIEGDGRLITRKGIERKNQIDLVLTVSGVTGTVTVGNTLTGGTSSAIGEVVAYFEVTSTTGVIFLKDTSGDFQAAETVTEGGFSATVDAVREDLTVKSLEKLTNDILVFDFNDATDTYLSRYIISTDTISIVRIFSASTDEVALARFGSLMCASNGVENIGYFSSNAQFLNYDNESGNFTVGLTVTGGTSSATGVISSLIDSGATGTLLLKNISGVFQNNEALTDTSTGAADVAGTLFDFFVIPGAPKAKVLSTYTREGRGTHLIAGNTDSGNGFVGSRVQWSVEYTDPLTLPFLDWTPTANVSDGDAGTYLMDDRGTVLSISSHKNRVYLFGEDGRGVYHLERIDVFNIGSSQISITDDSENDYGGFRGTETSKFGVAYANEGGAFFANFAQGDSVNSDLFQVIKDEEIEDFDLSDCDIIWDGKRYMYYTFRKNSSVNNLIKVFDTETGALSTFTNLLLSRFTRVDQGSLNTIYCTSSVGVIIYEFQKGFTDDGKDIRWKVRYRQEDGGDNTLLKSIEDVYHSGILSPDTLIEIRWNVWNRNNSAAQNAITYLWGGNAINASTFGYSATEYSSFVKNGNLLIGENLVHKSNPLLRFLKFQIELFSEGQVRHEIHMPYKTNTYGHYAVKLRNISSS